MERNVWNGSSAALDTEEVRCSKHQLPFYGIIVVIVVIPAITPEYRRPQARVERCEYSKVLAAPECRTGYREAQGWGHMWGAHQSSREGAHIGKLRNPAKNGGRSQFWALSPRQRRVGKSRTMGIRRTLLCSPEPIWTHIPLGFSAAWNLRDRHPKSPTRMGYRPQTWPRPSDVLAASLRSQVHMVRRPGGSAHLFPGHPLRSSWP